MPPDALEDCVGRIVRVATLDDIERELLGAVQQLAVIDGQVAANAVGIYKALGGSWNIEENTIDAGAAIVIVEDAG